MSGIIVQAAIENGIDSTFAFGATRVGRSIRRRRSDMPTLKRIYAAANAVDAHMLKDLLAQESIEALVRGDDFVPLQGGSLFRMETRPSVWVLNDDRLPRARELAAEFGSGRPPVPVAAAWRCRCGETMEGQFTACWRCGRGRPEGEPAP